MNWQQGKREKKSKEIVAQITSLKRLCSRSHCTSRCKVKFSSTRHHDISSHCNRITNTTQWINLFISHTGGFCDDLNCERIDFWMFYIWGLIVKLNNNNLTVSPSSDWISLTKLVLSFVTEVGGDLWELFSLWEMEFWEFLLMFLSDFSLDLFFLRSLWMRRLNDDFFTWNVSPSSSKKSWDRYSIKALWVNI